MVKCNYKLKQSEGVIMDNNNNITSAMALIERADLATVSETLKKISTFQKVVQSTLKDGYHYGVIPGTKLPTLYKAGAEVICQLMTVNPDYEFLDRIVDFEKGFFNYEIRCTLNHSVLTDGVLVKIPMSQGVGSCNSKEKKYNFINVLEKDLPEDIDKATCKKSTDKYGKVRYTIVNPDPYTLANTVLKMAKKRAYVDATLQLAALSQIFTQDTEDIKDLIGYDDVPVTNHTTTVTNTIADEEQNNPGDFIITFGQHNGKTINAIYDNGVGLSYIQYIGNKSKDAEVRKVVADFLASLGKPDMPVAKVVKATPIKEAIKDVTEQGNPFPSDEDFPFNL